MEEIVKAGKSKDRKPISEIDQELKDLFDDTAKGFTTVKCVFEYMRSCHLGRLIKTYGQEKGKQLQAWTLANNSIILNRKANMQLSMSVVNSAIALAQAHL